MFQKKRVNSPFFCYGMYWFAAQCSSARAPQFPGHSGFSTVSDLNFSDRVKAPLFSVLDFFPFVSTQLFSPTKRQLKYLPQSSQLYFDEGVNGVHHDTKQGFLEQHKSTKHQLIYLTSPQITPWVHSFTGGGVFTESHSRGRA